MQSLHRQMVQVEKAQQRINRREDMIQAKDVRQPLDAEAATEDDGAETIKLEKKAEKARLDRERRLERRM